MDFDVIFHCGNFEVREAALVVLSGSVKLASPIEKWFSPA